jgi:hypothetical protein
MMCLAAQAVLEGPLPQQEEPANRIANHAPAIDGFASTRRPVDSLSLGAFPQPLRHRPKDVPHHEQEGEKLE